MTNEIIQMHPNETLDNVRFEESFSKYFDGLFRYGMTMVRDQFQVEDIVQSVFTDLWQDRHSLNIHTSIQAYLYKAVYFKCMNALKHDKVVQKYKSSIPTDHETSDRGNPAILSEISEKINGTVASLPEQCRKIFVMNRYDGLRYQEIADQLQLSVKTIENQMGKALKTMKISLAEYLQIIIFHLIILF